MFASTLIDIPRPYIDPLTSLGEALGVASLVYQRPRTNSTIVLVLNHQRCGLHIAEIVPHHPFMWHDIVAESSHISLAHFVVVITSRTSSLMQSHDVQSFLDGTRALHNAGLTLLDWIIVGQGGLYCPRSFTSLTNPWPDAVTIL